MPRRLSPKHKIKIKCPSRSPTHPSRTRRRHRISRAPPRRWRNSRCLADGSAAVSPRHPSTPAQAGYDYTTAFRERVSSCSALPAGIDPNDKVSVKLRISFNRDGTLASPPRLLEPNASSKQKALLQSATEALERCQPFTMLPPEKYKQWKTFDVFIMPLNFFGG